MSAAIFGLLGVLVGGVLSSAGDAWLDRRRQLLEGMAAARLVSSELRTLELEVGWMLKSRSAAESPHVATLLWDEHRTGLAAVLSFANWQQAARAHTVSEWANQYAREANEALSTTELEVLKVGESEIVKAMAVLKDVGDGSRLTKAQRAMFRATGGWLK